MFEIKNVSKKYQDEFALNDVSMTIGEGLNFIIGSSGSGKTTLLKIISGMEQTFDGEAFYCAKKIKSINKEEKSYFYNNIFGFVWQDFNLLEDFTVLENVMLPQYLKINQDENIAMKILRDLKISELAKQKVSKLSGGQKQRVAIARELLKNPSVIFADEPTSALDSESSKIIMDILRNISKSKTVIIVTHDTSLINSKDNVYELDKGELILSPTTVQQSKSSKINMQHMNKLSLSNAFELSVKNAKNKLGHFLGAALSLLISATLLLITVSGAISDSSQSAFDELFATYGQGILDINIVGSFMSANGTNGGKSDKPSANVTQNIDGLYDKFCNDDRISHIAFTQAFNNISIDVDGKLYQIKSSGSVPTINELTAGVMPMGQGNEVIVPKSFVKELGISDKEALNKTITFKGSIYNWDSGEPVLMPTQITAKIVGVMDTTIKSGKPGEIFEYSIDDSFFFSKDAINNMRMQAKVQNNDSSFTIRAKSPAKLIEIKDELNSSGIVPLGRFELVEDMVRLNSQTSNQSTSAIILIGILSIIVALAVTIMTAITRKRDYAIFKVSGYSKNHLMMISIFEAFITATFSAIIFVLISPLTNLATKSFWDVNILNFTLLTSSIVLVFLVSMLESIVTAIISTTTKISTSLKTGDR